MDGLEVLKRHENLQGWYPVMPQVLFRQIKAKIPNWQAFYAEIERTINAEVKPELTGWFDKIVADWKNRPSFKAVSKTTQDWISVYVYPVGVNAKIWKYVSGGTRGPYPIPKPGNKRAKTLRFRWGGYGSYKARTTPQGGYKGPGKATGKMQSFKRVRHPGIKARNFERHIARWYQKRFRQTMKNAVARGLRKARA